MIMIIMIMDWIYSGLFVLFAQKHFYIEPIINSYHTMVSYMCSCPSANWRKHGSQSAPNGPSDHHRASTSWTLLLLWTTDGWLLFLQNFSARTHSPNWQTLQEEDSLHAQASAVALGASQISPSTPVWPCFSADLQQLLCVVIGFLMALQSSWALHWFRDGDRMTHHLPNIFRVRVPAKHFCLKADGARSFLWSAIIFSSGPGAPAGSLRIGWFGDGGLGWYVKLSDQSLKLNFSQRKLMTLGIENCLFCAFWEFRATCGEIYLSYIHTFLLPCVPQLYFPLLRYLVSLV